MKKHLLCAALLMAAPALVHAEPTAPATPASPSTHKHDGDSKEKYEAHFAKADKNGDGGLSMEELKATGDKAFPRIKEHFTQMDANGDGKVTLDERNTWAKANKKDAD